MITGPEFRTGRTDRKPDQILQGIRMAVIGPGRRQDELMRIGTAELFQDPVGVIEHIVGRQGQLTGGMQEIRVFRIPAHAQDIESASIRGFRYPADPPYRIGTGQDPVRSVLFPDQVTSVLLVIKRVSVGILRQQSSNVPIGSPQDLIKGKDPVRQGIDPAAVKKQAALLKGFLYLIFRVFLVLHAASASLSAAAS